MVIVMAMATMAQKALTQRGFAESARLLAGGFLAELRLEVPVRAPVEPLAGYRQQLASIHAAVKQFPTLGSGARF